MAKILVVDDDEAFQELIRAILESEGHEVLAQPAAAGTMELVAEALPDLIVLDIMMPGATGWELLNRLKANQVTAGVPILVCSAAVPDIVKARSGLRLLGVDAILKPFEVDELLVKVSTALRTNEQSRPGLSTCRGNA